MLSASVGNNPTVPPITGWHFYNFDTEEDEEDLSVTCSILSNSPSCTLTVSLSGLAKEFQPECEGEYQDTGLKSSGRQVAEAQHTIFNPMPLQLFPGVQSDAPIGPLPFCRAWHVGMEYTALFGIKGQLLDERGSRTGLPCPPKQ